MPPNPEGSFRREESDLASIGRRAVAYAIDDILISLIFVILLWEPISMAQNPERVAEIINGVWLFMAAAQIIYHTLFVWLYGASLGKMAVGIRVADATTLGRPGLQSSFNRAVFRVVSGVVFYLGYLWALFDPMRQAWHDKTASTLVVNA
ncbi:hypothetical protein NNO_0433 [Hydrogenimonas sp.]|nr:hypothetical protein NNO_0433 [Hydrogenimonas sp.]